MNPKNKKNETSQSNCWKAMIKKDCQARTISTKIVFRNKDDKMI